MRLFLTQWICRFVAPIIIIATMLSASALSVLAANLGTIVPVVGQISDLLHDGSRNLVYLANASRHQVDIYSVDGRRLIGSIATGLQPASLALSPDGNTLYVSNVGSFSITAINLNLQQVMADYMLASRPDAIAVGNDGDLVILGTAGLQRLNPSTRQLTPVVISPPATPPAGLPPINASPTPAGFLAGLVSTANGNLIIGLSNTRLFVYGVASGTVLRSRNVTGLRAILSASPDGSRFMAGPFLFDTETLTILGRAGSVAPTLTGGSVFSVEGNSVYATFSTQVPINPLNTNNPQNPGGAFIPGGVPGQTSAQPTQAVLQVLRSSSLTQELGLRLAEPVTSKIVSSTDGQFLFANSTSGLTVIPVGQLRSLPILDVSASNVVLSLDPCNRTVATASIQIRNAGGGRLTFAASPVNQGAPIVLGQRSGVAPATLTISFDARTIIPLGTLQFVVMLVSPEAVNVEPAILVNVNYRDVSQRGRIVPITGVGVDLQIDTPRQRLYIANYTRDQIEVFSLVTQSFLPPIRVGNRPLSITMANPSTLVVANSGAEHISVVDLDAMQEVDQIPMSPIPLNATPLFPRSIAASSNAVLFSAVPLSVNPLLPGGNGSIWQLSLLTRTAFPRLNLGTGILNFIQGRNILTAPANGSAIATVEGNGTLRLYDPLSDAFVLTRPASVPQLRGTATATLDGNFFVVDNSVFNPVLVSQGTIAPAGVVPAQAVAFGVAGGANFVVRIQAATPQTGIQTLQRFNLATLQPELQILLPEQAMDISPAIVGNINGTRQWPPRVTALELGANNQTQLLPRGITLDNNNNAYVLTFSGLSVVSLVSSTGRTPIFTTAGVVNSPSRLGGAVSPGALISILGSNLADPEAVTATPLPSSLGGVCVTANEVAIPLIMTSPSRIDAQLPANLPTGRITLTVRSTRFGVSSAGVLVQVNPSSPSLFSVPIDGVQRAGVFHAADMMLVTPEYPAERDEHLIIYASGLGPATPQVQAGQLNPVTPASATTMPVTVTIGGVRYDVVSSILAPGFVGVYQITVSVPGNRTRGDNLPVVITAGGASSAVNNAPLTAIR